MTISGVHTALGRGHLLLLGLLVLAMLAAGCSPYRVVSNQVFRFSEKNVVPRALAADDLRIDCATALTFTGPVMSLSRLGTNVERMGILTWMGSGLCAEQQAVELELAYLRALQQQDPIRAQDIRTAQKRVNALAAYREYEAWKLFERLYHDPTPEHCPELRSDTDELAFLVGLMAGIQATVNAVQGGTGVAVPRELGPRAVKLSVCVNDEKWWNLPTAMHAALWQAIPIFAPEQMQEPPLVTLQRVATRGKRDGVRLGHAVWALIAANAGDHEQVRTVLHDFVDLPPDWKPDPRYRILDVVATEIMLALSDRVWTIQTGHRTPFGALGRLPDDPLPGKHYDISDLFE